MPPTFKNRYGLRVRPAISADAVEISRLCGQLTPSNTDLDIRRRLARLSRSDSNQIFVAEVPDGDPSAPRDCPRRLAGWVQVLLLDLLVSDTGAAVTGLVVDRENRNLGVGRSLLEQAEEWARGHGCRTVVVRSREHRTAAHAFYERLGYQSHKRQLAFRKLL